MKIFSTQKNYNLPIYDYNLIWTTLLLLGTSLVMVYSSSIDIAAASKSLNYQNYYYLLRQSIYILLGLILGYIAFQIPIYFWQKMAPYIFILGLILLILVLIPGIGKEVNGSQRWISLGITNFQPSEFVKLATIIYASDYVLRKSKQMRTIVKGFLPMLGVVVFTGFLLLLEPDFGALAVITMVAMGILFLGGLSYKIFFGLMIFTPISIYFLIVNSPYRMQRIVAFLDPWADPYGKGYQLIHSLIAFGRGEYFGVGLGASVEKQLYLPEAHTDFILAVIGEEFGLFGVRSLQKIRNGSRNATHPHSSSKPNFHLIVVSSCRGSSPTTGVEGRCLGGAPPSARRWRGRGGRWQALRVQSGGGNLEDGLPPSAKPEKRTKTNQRL